MPCLKSYNDWILIVLVEVPPSPSCEICGLVDYLIVNCQVGSSFTQDASESVNYVNNFHPRPINDPFSNTYNLGWRNQLNFSYRSNAPPSPQINFRQPLVFQRPPYPQQAPQKSNTEPVLETILLRNKRKMRILSN